MNTKRSPHTSFLAGCLLLLCGMLLPVSGHADGIAPQYSTISIKPGETKKVLVTVMQNRAKSAEVNLIAAHCTLDKGGKLVFSDTFSDLGLGTEQSRYSAAPFIKPEKVKLALDEWHEVTLTVTVPKSTPAGEYYAAVVAKPSNLVSVISVLVDSPSNKAACRITSVETAIADNQMVIRSLIENAGPRTVTPSATALIKKEGKLVDAVSLDLAGRNYDFLMHDTKREFSGTLQNILPVYGSYSAEVVVDCGQGVKTTATKEFAVDNKLYLRQKGFTTVQASPSSVKLAIPPSGFYLFPVSVKNLDSEPITVKIYASEMWASPAFTQVTLQPDESRDIPLSLTTPDSFRKLETKVVFVPSRGRPYQTLVKVFPKGAAH